METTQKETADSLIRNGHGPITKGECGCLAWLVDDDAPGEVVEFQYCPTHEQAPALVAALSAMLAKIAIDRIEMECPVCNCHEVPDIDCKAELAQARSVLAAIRGAT